MVMSVRLHPCGSVMVSAAGTPSNCVVQLMNFTLLSTEALPVLSIADPVLDTMFLTTTRVKLSDTRLEDWKNEPIAF